MVAPWGSYVTRMGDNILRQASDTQSVVRSTEGANILRAAVDQDHVIAKSIADAVHWDGPLLQREIQIQRGHELAWRLANEEEEEEQEHDDHDDDDADQGEPQRTEDAETSGHGFWLDHEVLSRADAIYQRGDASDSDHDGQPESSAQAAARVAKRQLPQKECTACGDGKPDYDTATAPCGHLYCSDCLSNLFRHAITDETLFPPSCCQQEMPYGKMRYFLESELAVEFANRREELSTSNRTYCFDRQCSAFIHPSTIIGDVANCPTCHRSTCTICKAAGHNGDCPQDVDLQQLNQTAQNEGWRRCQCGRFIELHYGCNHMTCVCRYEFCYLCGARWKTCGCPQWTEQRLYRRAEQIIDRRPPDRAAEQPPIRAVPAVATNVAVRAAIPQPAAFRADVRPPAAARPPAAVQANARRQGTENVARQLRENRQCAHPDRWRRFNEYHRCPVCHKGRNGIVGECRRCFTVACYYCRRHRRV